MTYIVVFGHSKYFNSGFELILINNEHLNDAFRGKNHIEIRNFDFLREKKHQLKRFFHSIIKDL